jgi:alcohol dehydrogenase (cytochrome c)
MKWEFRLHSPSWVGTLATAGGLVFSGTDEGNFFALDAVTGKPLWDMNLGASLRSNPVTFSAGGKQYVFVTAGTTYFVFGLP